MVNPMKTGAASRRSAVLMAFAVVSLAVIVIASRATRSGSGGQGGTVTADQASASNPIVAYNVALVSGKPVYVLFHSTTCRSCIEMTKVCDEVLPEHKGRVAFVDVVTDDPASEDMVNRFKIDTIPTSIFIKKGKVVDGFVGEMSAEQLEYYLAEVEG